MSPPKLLLSGALLLGFWLLHKTTAKKKAIPPPKKNRSPNLNTNTVAKGKTIRLMSSDGKTFEVEESVALQSQTIRNMIEDGCAKDVIPLPNVTAKILDMIIEYCRMHADSPKSDNLAADLIAADEFRSWDSEFVNVKNSTLLALILAANYLNINSLLDLTCQTVADMIKGKTPEELRKTFNLKNDFSPAELEEVRRENQWSFE